MQSLSTAEIRDNITWTMARTEKKEITPSFVFMLQNTIILEKS